MSEIATLKGTVGSVNYRSLITNYHVLRLRTGETVVGTFRSRITQGEEYDFFGSWKDHPRFGRQFQAAMGVPVIPPGDGSGASLYIERHVPGVGLARAEALRARYGGRLLEVIRETPSLPVEDGILTPEQAAAAQSLLAGVGFDETHAGLLELFYRRGFHLARALVGSVIAFGATAHTVVRGDPLVLTIRRVPGCPFPAVARLYRELGFPESDTRFQTLTVWDRLRKNREGHTWLPQSFLRQALADRGDPSAAAAVAEYGAGHDWLSFRPGLMSTAAWSDQELSAAADVRRLLPGPPWPSPSGLSPHQAGALAPCLPSPVFCLVGTPGTGKTYTAARLVASLPPGSRVAVVAPTGKAAVRVRSSLESSGVVVPCSTIHSLLMGMRERSPDDDYSSDPDGAGVFAHGRSHPIPYDYLVVDEASMIDMGLFRSLVAAVPSGCRLLFVGDTNQLPPVGHGAPFRDLIDSGLVPVAALTEIRRNAGRIVLTCASLAAGGPLVPAPRYDPDSGDNLRLFPAASEDEIAFVLREVVPKLISRFGADGVQILCATNSGGLLGREVLNRDFAAVFNPSRRDSPLSEGDRVICLSNGHYPDESGDPHYVANGEMGTVTCRREDYLLARFSGEEVAFPRAQWPGGGSQVIDLGFACTTHKFQGSEAPCVVVPIDPSFRAGLVCSRPWWYTAISRARSLCVLVGREGVLRSHCAKNPVVARRTCFKEALCGSRPPSCSTTGSNSPTPSPA